MSSVSGSAAGNPSGMTAASRTLGSHEHHWFQEPTEPAKKSFVFWLIVAQFIFFVALLGPAIVGIGLQRDDAQIDHLAQRAVNRLARNAQVAGYVGRAHDPADDIGHDHRLRAIDVWPAAFVKARLKTFVEPAEALEQGDDKLVREHGECWKSRKFAALAAAAR